MIQRVLLFLCIPFMLSAATWDLVGISGSRYPISVQTKKTHNYVAVYQVWKSLNLSRKEWGDTLICSYKDNELRIIKNQSSYFFNGKKEQLKKSLASFVKGGTTYAEVSAFCVLMNRLTSLRFIADPHKKHIQVLRDDGFHAIGGVVVIDPGHGGKDPGAIGQNNLYEKEVVLAISHELQTFLKKTTDMKVLLTRTEDVFIPLRDRAAFANQHNADLFVSIHANASLKKNEVGGFKMYFLADAENETDAATARLENASLQFEETTESSSFLESILLDMAYNEHVRECQELSILMAESFEREVTKVDKLHTGVGQANFFVLRGAAMPAVLVETAFISNEREEKLLQNGSFQRDAARAIGEAIIAFRERYRDGVGK